MGVRLVPGGDTKNTDAFLDRMINGDLTPDLDSLAQRGVDALRQATPRESGATADAWSYEIERDGNNVTIWWVNDHQVDGFNVAIGLQYGHGTDGGGWVQGEDFINPALKPIFDEIADGMWKEVQRA